MIGNKPIYGCYSVGYENKNSQKFVVLRNTGEFDSMLFGDIHQHGKVLAVSGSRGNLGSAIESHLLMNEGTTSLAAYAGEDWTAQAPSETVFTARGNFSGFFLKNTETTATALLALGVSKQDIALTCSSDAEEIAYKVKQILAYDLLKNNPMPFKVDCTFTALSKTEATLGKSETTHCVHYLTLDSLSHETKTRLSTLGCNSGDYDLEFSFEKSNYAQGVNNLNILFLKKNNRDQWKSIGRDSLLVGAGASSSISFSRSVNSSSIRCNLESGK